MSILTYPNMTMANMTMILGDYNTKFAGVVSFWFLVLIVIGIILFNQLSRLTFGIASIATTLVLVLIALPLGAMGLLSWGYVMMFATLFILAVFVFLIST